MKPTLRVNLNSRQDQVPHSIVHPTLLMIKVILKPHFSWPQQANILIFDEYHLQKCLGKERKERMVYVTILMKFTVLDTDVRGREGEKKGWEEEMGDQKLDHEQKIQLRILAICGTMECQYMIIGTLKKEGRIKVRMLQMFINTSSTYNFIAQTTIKNQRLTLSLCPKLKV